MTDTEKPKITPPEVLKGEANKQGRSTFDYIIVGSGAGGGPLACRLARAKKRVLLIEAGPDPQIAKEVYEAPLFHAAATEHPDLSWDFSVRHYDCDAKQEADHKYEPSHDLWAVDGEKAKEKQDERKKGGIFYPRSSGLGGCTSHHAMIVVRPNDRDWDHIAELTNDSTWRAGNMQPYFAKMEKCLYLDEYRGFLVKVFGWLFRLWLRLMRFINPRSVLDQGGHGTKGWQPTNFISPELIKKILKTDNEFTTILVKSAFRVIQRNSSLTALLKRWLIRFGFVRAFDPNDVGTREANRDGGVFLIPTGVGSDKVRDENGVSLKGRRAGVREFIRRTQEECKEHIKTFIKGDPSKGVEDRTEVEIRDYLVVEENFHVEEVLFEEGTKPLRAVGVRGTKGSNLYSASPKAPGNAAGKSSPYYVRHTKSPGHEKDREHLLPKGEVILAGGAFNTPQLLMLSGIGDRTELELVRIKTRVHLPGVGRNLQDRYEVGVINELKSDLSSLNTLSFDPEDSKDKLLDEWKKKKEGLYTSNGGTITILQRSSVADGPEWDLFTFGAPAAFRGYYRGWSKELLRPTKGAAEPQRNLWTWVILKAYTRNNGGQVTLRTSNAFDTPSIRFHSFEEGGVEGWNKDVQALAEAVEWMREINSVSGSPFGVELQPRRFLEQANNRREAAGQTPWTLHDWIRNEAWGHHACGTCRIGSDPWRKDPAELRDKLAVLDSRFQVHGVKGLRVVDASVFPKIPGYFILAPIFMVSEKAADTLIQEEDNESYPHAIREVEEEAIRTRRLAAQVKEDNTYVPAGGKPPAGTDRKPIENVVGLALSGGGVRSSTFSLGVLQALAEKGILRHVDFLSTVSGGCFTGSFLGRLFTRPLIKDSHDPAGRVQDLLKDNRSNPIRWLRAQANYLFASGTDDWLMALGVYFRNVFSVHLMLGLLLLFAFGALAGFGHSAIGQRMLPHPPVLPERLPILISLWWWTPLAFLVIVAAPMALGFWLAPLRDSYRSHPPGALAAWVILLVGACALLAFPFTFALTGIPLVILLMAWVWQEVSRRDLLKKYRPQRNLEGIVVRNRLTRGVGEALVIFVFLVGWVILDSLARTVASPAGLTWMMTALVLLAPVLPFLRTWAMGAFKKISPSRSFSMQLLGLILGLALLFLADVIGHTLFRVADWRWAWGALLIALLASICLGRSFNFLNLSSLNTAYHARISRTFLGASNKARTLNAANIASDVSIAHPDDDIAHHDYRPEESGGPLHLITVCVNETVDYASQREIRERQGVPMTVGSFGVSLGRRYFATWSKKIEMPRWLRFRRSLQGLDRSLRDCPPSLEAIRLNADPGTFHPLGRQDENPAVVEALSLGEWTAISGAAFSTGSGRETKPLQSLLLGLLNIRLGYWWDSGVRATERPGRFPSNIWRRLKEIPGEIFKTQHLLFSEWRGRFQGPSHEFWNLSDGGHLDNSAIYELIRRRVDYIICTDATHDPAYTFADFANMARLVRVDLGVEIEWQPPANLVLPDLFKKWIDPNKVGTPDDILGNMGHGGTGKKHAALALARHPNGHQTWILVIKTSLTPDDPLDVKQYAAAESDFPQDSTAEQIYNDERWESYRHLGCASGSQLFTQQPT